MADPKPKLVIVYGTGTNNTKAVAEGIESGARDEGVDTILLNVADISKEEIVAEITGAQGVAIGSPTYNRKPVPAIVTLVDMLQDVNMEGKVCATFGAYGHSGEAPKTLKRVLKPCNMEQMDVLRILGKPSGPTLDECRKYGAEIAGKMLGK
ncbi:MAG: FprA family A-type flavoprotein [ANME-2 cluster archaeon]|jgi:flavorubredoxin|nr:MAG: FprA family A-type flavoprotein [ANME-2 cluster archaeon]